MNTLKLTRDGKAVKPEALLPSDPVSAGQKTRTILDELRGEIRRSDLLLVKGNRIDFGATQTLVLPECVVQGDGSAGWLTHCKIDWTAGQAYLQAKDDPQRWDLSPVRSKPSSTCGFSIGRFVRLENFYLGGDCWDTEEDGGLIGFVGEDEAVAEFHGCHLDASQGMDWGIYAWNSRARRTIRLNKSRFDYCVLGIAAAASAGPPQTVEVDECTFFGDANGSRSIGDSRNMGADPNKWGVLSAVLCRMGNVTLRDSRFAARGLREEHAELWGCPRIAAVCTNHYHDVSGPTSFKVERCTAGSIEPGTAREWCHVDLRGERYLYEEVPHKLLLRNAA